MAITNIKVSNFKSFKNLDLNLGRFNVVIGANASGKSNFVEIFRFLKTVEDNDLDDAVSLNGGLNSIVNLKAGPSAPFGIEVTSDREMAWGRGSPTIRVRQTTYGFSLRSGYEGNGVAIDEDHVAQMLRIEEHEIPTEQGSYERIAAQETSLRIRLSRGEKPELRFEPRSVDTRGLANDPRFSALDNYLATLLEEMNRGQPKTLLIRAHFLNVLRPWESLFGHVGIYDINPDLAKSPSRMAGKAELHENAENLALVLRQILGDAEKRRKFHNLLRYVLPFAIEIGTEQYLGESVLLKLREEYYGSDLLANLLSDGTVDAAALVTALFFEDKDVIIIEEPERNVHPHLISGLMELMKDAARNRQIILTTHSPEVVKHAGVENLLLISRDKEGFSGVSRPAEKQEVKIFLENDLGLDEVFVQELWGI
jgi:predicted ATPase